MKLVYLASLRVSFRIETETRPYHTAAQSQLKDRAAFGSQQRGKFRAVKRTGWDGFLGEDGGREAQGAAMVAGAQCSSSLPSTTRHA